MSALQALPIPRLIAVEIDRSNPPDMQLIKTALSQNFEGVTLDDHRRWQAQIRTMTRSFALGGLAILLLVGAATTAVIVSATGAPWPPTARSSRCCISSAPTTLHRREFERHFLRLGRAGGLIGGVAAALAFLMLPLMRTCSAAASSRGGNPAA